MRRIVGKQNGFTLVELMITVAIVSILAALAIYGVGKYVATAKTSEARNAVGQIAKDVTTAFLRESMAGTTLTLGTTAAKSNALCDSGPKVPLDVAAVAGRKYQSSPSEWNAGWLCLRFSVQDPQYYQYQYLRTGTGDEAGSTFDIYARGNLDADTITSEFRFQGALVPDGADLVLVTGPNVGEINSDE